MGKQVNTGVLIQQQQKTPRGIIIPRSGLKNPANRLEGPPLGAFVPKKGG